ncbi:MAG: hypothetical protein H0U27_04890 [Nitrosopumilus sp.]|nr:hypothetical protein [Nitrosopumilus sp.]
MTYIVRYETPQEEADFYKNYNAFCDAKDKLVELEAYKSTLETQKSTLETQKSTLEAQKSIFEAQKSTLEARKSTLKEEESSLRVELATAETLYRVGQENVQKKLNTAQDMKAQSKDLADQSLMLKERASSNQQKASQLHHQAQSGREQIAKKMIDNTDKLIVALNSRINNLAKANDYEKNKVLLENLNNLIKTGEGLKVEIQPTKIALESVKPKLQKFGTECSAVLPITRAV